MCSNIRSNKNLPPFVSAFLLIFSIFSKNYKNWILYQEHSMAGGKCSFFDNWRIRLNIRSNKNLPPRVSDILVRCWIFGKNWVLYQEHRNGRRWIKVSWQLAHKPKNQEQLKFTSLRFCSPNKISWQFGEQNSNQD